MSSSNRNNETHIMQQRRGKPPACADFFNCSLSEDEQNNWHMQTYHDPGLPAVIPNPDPALPPITVHRDPNRGMYYPCTHPDCDHTSILRTNPAQHYGHCKFLQRDLQAAIVATDAPQQTQKTQQTTRHNQRPQLHLRRTANQPLSSSSSTSHSVATVPRPLTRSASFYTRSASKTSTSTSTLLLTSVDQLTDTLGRLEKRLGRQTKTMGEMNKQLDWLMNQTKEIRTQNASLDTHTESIRIDMDMMEDHLGGLWQDNYELKKQLKGLRQSSSKEGVKSEDQGYQRVAHL